MLVTHGYYGLKPRVAFVVETVCGPPCTRKKSPLRRWRKEMLDYEDGVVRGGTICQRDDPATAPDDRTREALRNLAPMKVENRRAVPERKCSCGCTHCCA